MTLLSRRKLRITARRITPLTLAASAVAVLALCAAPGFTQPPGSRPTNPLNYQQPGNGNQQPGALPLPPGYRPRTPPPQPQQRPATTGVPGAMPGSGGQVMYFQKPADALTATGGPGSSVGSPVGEVAQLNTPGRVPLAGVPDVPVSTLQPPPPPPPSRYAPPAAAIGYNAQPEPQPKPVDPLDPLTSTSRKQIPIPSVPDEATRLPARERIFMVYDDRQLEIAIMQILLDDQIKDQQRKIEDAKAALKIAETNKKQEDIDKAKMDIAAAQSKIDSLKVTFENPTRVETYRFPPLPVVSPPGVQYQAKTSAYPPRQAILEPGYVVHRKLHFEERNAERMGWDLGPMQTLVSAGYFWRDVFLLPQSVVSGWCRGAWDTNAGKCLPGSPSPYYIYPLGLTASGTAFETLSAVGIGFAFFP